MLIVFLILIFGFFTADRILHEVVGQNILTKKQMTKFGTAYVLVIVSFSFFTSSILVLWMLSFTPQLVFWIFIAFLKRYRSQKFEERFEEILGLMILKMKSGKAFRSAFSEVISESPYGIQRILIDIRDVVVFSQLKNSVKLSAFIKLILIEFVQADQAPHAALKRLVSFRDRLKIQTDFRRKSGQVMQQIRIQSLILSGVYFALFIFVIKRFGFESNHQMILLSVSLFLTGIAFIFYRGNKIKWKI